MWAQPGRRCDDEAVDVPATVTLHVWHVPRRHVATALGRMALDRRVRREPGVRLAKLLGTSDGRTFALRDTQLTRWALLVAWDDADAAAAFESGRTARAWAGIANETLRVELRPLITRGQWDRGTPFGDPAPRRWDGPVASLTRARIRARDVVAFHRAVPRVSADLRQAPGLRLALGVGDAPIGLLGTFSIWESAADLQAFAYRRTAHTDVIRRTAERQWFAESLFTRFAVTALRGTFDGRAP